MNRLHLKLNIPNVKLSLSECQPEPKSSEFKYSFKVSAEELVDLREISNDLSRERPCIMVKTKRVKESLCNYILVHNSIRIKSHALGINMPCVASFEVHNGIIFDLSKRSDAISLNEHISDIVSWAKRVKKMSVHGTLNDEINNKPIEIDVIEVKL